MVKDFLKRSDYEVIAAKDGAEALKVVEVNP